MAIDVQRIGISLMLLTVSLIWSDTKIKNTDHLPETPLLGFLWLNGFVEIQNQSKKGENPIYYQKQPSIILTNVNLL